MKKALSGGEDAQFALKQGLQIGIAHWPEYVRLGAEPPLGDTDAEGFALAAIDGNQRQKHDKWIHHESHRSEKLLCAVGVADFTLLKMPVGGAQAVDVRDNNIRVGETAGILFAGVVAEVHREARIQPCDALIAPVPLSF